MIHHYVELTFRQREIHAGIQASVQIRVVHLLQIYISSIRYFLVCIKMQHIIFSMYQNATYSCCVFIRLIVYTLFVLIWKTNAAD